MQANELKPCLYPERPDSSQYLCREEFRHDPGEKRRPYVCIHSELSSGDGLIQCSMEMDPPSQEYVCLSYMWGPQAAQKSILIDGRLFRVRDNLWKFLNRARHTGVTRPIWIDAICIDQTNVRMRNHWVQQMGRIFEGAVEVLVWLGDGDPVIEIALDVMEYIGASCSPNCILINRKTVLKGEAIFHERTSETHHRGSFHEAIEKLVSLPYWDRLWIKQEVLLNRTVYYLYGEAVNSHLRHLLCFCDRSGQLCNDHKAYGVGRTASTKLLELSKRNAVNMQNLRPLEDLIKRFGDSAWMDVRDRVYGLLGMTEGCTLTVDYMISPTELFVRTLVATSPFPNVGKTKSIIEHFSALFNGLELSEDDLWRDDIDGLLRRYEGTYWQKGYGPSMAIGEKGTIGLRLAPFALFARLDSQDANSLKRRKEVVLPEDVAERLELIPPASHLARNVRLDTLHIDEVWPNNKEIDKVTGEVFLIGGIHLRTGDVMFKLAYLHDSSGLFLVGRVCKLQPTVFEVIAVAESACSFTSFQKQKALLYEHDSRLEICGAPTAFKRISISHLRNETFFNHSFQMNLGIREMASISRILNTQSSVPSWSWKTERRAVIATASIFNV